MSHRAAVGGMWEEIGQLQFDFLVARGLLPEHYLLDIGCGSLRGGVHFIRYLEAGHYYGLEKERWLLMAGQMREITKQQLEEKQPHFIVNDSFDLSLVPEEVRFDFMLAHSVFTHLMPEQIGLCLQSVKPRLAEGGSLYATFWESKRGVVTFGRPHPDRKGERRFVRYTREALEDLATEVECGLEYIGEWGHPRGQRMVRFCQ